MTDPTSERAGADYAWVWPPRLAHQPLMEVLLGLPVSSRPRPGFSPTLQVLARGSWARRTHYSAPLWYAEDGPIRSGSAHCAGALSMIFCDATSGRDVAQVAGEPARTRIGELLGDRAALETAGALANEALQQVVSLRISRVADAPQRLPAELPRQRARPRLLLAPEPADGRPLPARLYSTRCDALLARAAERHADAELWIDARSAPTAFALSPNARKRGVRLLRERVNPFVLLEAFDRVLTLDAQVGFEALLLGLPVTALASAFYAGRGLTDDGPDVAALAPRTREQIFTAAYVLAPRYLALNRGRLGTVMDAIEAIREDRRVRDARRIDGPLQLEGFARWKRPYCAPFLAALSDDLHWDMRGSAAEGITRARWSAPAALESPAEKIWSVEDGFIRSIGLGSDLIRPWSLIVDDFGLYFDPRRPSRLEQLLEDGTFDPDLLARARRLRERIVETGVTKYNPSRPSGSGRVRRPTDRSCVWVPGQVEDDASVRFGGGDIGSGIQLLEAVRERQPRAFIVYRPHPDVLAGNRRGLIEAKRLCDAIDLEPDPLVWMQHCDEVHTLTSLAGFEALLRGRRVVVYGRPFYAGWGLTEDRVCIDRRRRVSLDELTAAALILYPLYRDWDFGLFTTCEAVVERFARHLHNAQASSPEAARWRPLRRVSRWMRNVLMDRTWF